MWLIQHLNKINRLFVLTLKNGNYDPTVNSFDEYSMLLVEIKDFNAFIDNKPFFDQSIKNKHTTGNLLHFSNYENNYKVIGIDLSRKTNTNIFQKINFTETLEKDNYATMFFITEKQQKTIINLSLDSLIVVE